MTSKTLELTSTWYELQADTDSEEDSASSWHSLPNHLTHFTQYPVGRGHCIPLPTFSDVSVQSSGQHTGRGSLIQQLLEEMDDANQKIDHYSGSKKIDSGLEEYLISRKEVGSEGSSCEDAVTSVIAEVSRNFTAGNLSAGPQASDSDQSHLSSDNDFRHRHGAAYAKYPESAAGLSDNDWNPYVMESDTNMSPRVAYDLRPVSVTGDLKGSSFMSSFNPPFCSSKVSSSEGKVSTSGFQLTDNKSTCSRELLSQLGRIKEGPQLSMHGSFAPSPHSTSSELSEYSINTRINFNASSSPGSKEDPVRSLQNGYDCTSCPQNMEKEMTGANSPLVGTSATITKSAVSGVPDRRCQDRVDSGVDCTQLNENFKKLSTFADGPKQSSWDIRSSLPGRGYFSEAVQQALSSEEYLQHDRHASGVDIHCNKTTVDSGISASDLAKMATTRATNIFDGKRPLTLSSVTEVTKSSGNSHDFDTVMSASLADTVTKIPAYQGSKVDDHWPGTKPHDFLTEQVNQLLRETAYLTNSSRARDRGSRKDLTALSAAARTAASLDYDRLHRDLQEIQDSLHNMGQPQINSPNLATETSATAISGTSTDLSPPLGSDTKSNTDEGDIVPSTTTTPERVRHLMWDYGADLGCRGNNFSQYEGMMSDMTTGSSAIDRLSADRRYTSDGEETRMSSLDHGEEEEEHQEEATLGLKIQLGQAAAAAAPDTYSGPLLSTFRSQSQALGSQYQEVRAQGMVDKVMTILGSTNPDLQAKGILSQVSAQERELWRREVGNNSNINASIEDSSLDNTLLKTMDCVSRRLELSGLSDSTVDLSKSAPSFVSGPVKPESAFSATAAAQDLISAQMKKAADRTFNHSLEFTAPVWQEMQVYPVYSTQGQQPQYQRLQQQLVEQLRKKGKDQGKEESLSSRAALREAWPEKDKLSLATDTSPKDVTESTFKQLLDDERERPTGDDSPSSANELDKKSEIKKGKYRPYRPAGSQDVYYTDSDTASIAESVTTVESTHTGSDDAMAPSFPSSILGSRRETAPGLSGIYSKHSGPAASSHQLLLPTIEERAALDSQELYSPGNSERVTPAEAGADKPVVRCLSDSIVACKRNAEAKDILAEKESSEKSSNALSSNGDKPKNGSRESANEDSAAVHSRRQDARLASTSPSATDRLTLTAQSLHHDQRERDTTQHTHLASSDSGLLRSRIPISVALPRDNQSKSDTHISHRQQSAEGIDSPQKNIANVREEKVTQERKPQKTVDRDLEVKSVTEQKAGQQSDSTLAASSSRSSTVPSLPQPDSSGLAIEMRHQRPGSGSSGHSVSSESRSLGNTKASGLVLSANKQEHRQLSDVEEGVRGGPRHLQPDGEKAATRIEATAKGSKEDKAKDSTTVHQMQSSSLDKALSAAGPRQETEAEYSTVKCQGTSSRSRSGSREGWQEMETVVRDPSYFKDLMQRQQLEAQLALEHQQREQERQEAAARREAVLAAAEARRTASVLKEQERKKELEREKRKKELEREVRKKELEREEIKRELEREEIKRELEREEIKRELEREERKKELERESRDAEARLQAQKQWEAEQHLEEQWRRDAEHNRQIEAQIMSERRLREEIQMERALLEEAVQKRAATETKRIIQQEAEEAIQRESERVILRETEEAILRETKRAAQKKVEAAFQEEAEEAQRRKEQYLQSRQKQQEVEEAIARAGGAPHPDSTTREHSLSLENEARDNLSHNHHLLDQQGMEEALDQQPLSHHAQLLSQVVSQEAAYQERLDLQLLWEHYMASIEEPESSLGSEKLITLAELLRDPSQHLVHTFLTQRQQQHQADLQRAEQHRLGEHQQQEEENKAMKQERAFLERELKRQSARRQWQGHSSEEESNGSYGEILQQRERDRLKRRELRLQQRGRKSPGKEMSPASTLSKVSRSSFQHSAKSPNHSISKDAKLEALYSIPEDTIGLEALTLQKSRSPNRIQSSEHLQKADVIDPCMNKLRQRIAQQREKIGHVHAKDLLRQQKLEKLQILLKAKCAGLMDSVTVATHLASISSTSGPTSDDSAAALSQVMLTGSSGTTEDSTTAKDSSTEMRLSRLAREKTSQSYGLDIERILDSTRLYKSLVEDSSTVTETTEESVHLRHVRVSSKRHKRGFTADHADHAQGSQSKFHQMYSPYSRSHFLQPTKDELLIGKASPYKKTKDFGAMYPSPRVFKYIMRSPSQGKNKASCLVSRGIQTSPDGRIAQPRQLSFSPHFEGLPKHQGPHQKPCSCCSKNVDTLLAATHMLSRSKVPKDKHFEQERSVSPAFDSQQVAACLSPDRERPHSASPGRDRHRSSSPNRLTGNSPMELRLKAWSDRERRLPVKDVAQGLFNENRENRPPVKQQRSKKPSLVSAATSWFIPLKEHRPWRQPLKERQAYAASLKGWRPAGLSHKQWRELARADLEEVEWGLQGSREGEAARIYLHKVTREAEQELGQEYDKFEEKPLCRMSLQEALMNRRPDFISAVRQRQKRLKLAAEHRALQALVKAEQERLFADQRHHQANPDAHPLSENLYQPKRRVFSKQEMIELTKKKYKNLPEVKEKEIYTRRIEEYKLNRLRAKVFNKRLQGKVLQVSKGIKTC